MVAHFTVFIQKWQKNKFTHSFLKSTVMISEYSSVKWWQFRCSPISDKNFYNSKSYLGGSGAHAESSGVLLAGLLQLRRSTWATLHYLVKLTAKASWLVLEDKERSGSLVRIVPTLGLPPHLERLSSLCTNHVALANTKILIKSV